MKNILWDHIRRWWWVWLAGGVFYGVIVWSGVPGRADWQAAFFPIAIYWGMLQLNLDLTRGEVPRVLRTLPVTAKAIGRAWWWVCVGLPALTLAVITGLVFEFAVHFTHRSVSGVGCFYFWLSNALLFGPVFFFFTRTPAAGKGYGRGLRGCLFSLLFAATFFGMMLFYRLFPPHTVQWDVFVVLAPLLTWASWFGPETFAQERLGALLTVTFQAHSAAEAMERTDQFMARFSRTQPSGTAFRSPGKAGCGSLRMLFQTRFRAVFGLGLLMVVIPGLILFRSVSVENQEMFFGMFWPLVSVFLGVACVWVAPQFVPQTRALRMLPVSATRLATVLVGAPVAALLAALLLGSLILGLIYWLPQIFFLSLIHSRCLLPPAISILVVPAIVWRGGKALGFGPAVAVVVILLMGAARGLNFIREHISPAASTGLSLLIVLAAFLLTKRLLERSNRRTQALER
jgi:hypothetical protein